MGQWRCPLLAKWRRSLPKWSPFSQKLHLDCSCHWFSNQKLFLHLVTVLHIMYFLCFEYKRTAVVPFLLSNSCKVSFLLFSFFVLLRDKQQIYRKVFGVSANPAWNKTFHLLMYKWVTSWLVDVKPSLLFPWGLFHKATLPNKPGLFWLVQIFFQLIWSHAASLMQFQVQLPWQRIMGVACFPSSSPKCLYIPGVFASFFMLRTPKVTEIRPPLSQSHGSIALLELLFLCRSSIIWTAYYPPPPELLSHTTASTHLQPHFCSSYSVGLCFTAQIFFQPGQRPLSLTLLVYNKSLLKTASSSAFQNVEGAKKLYFGQK